MSSTSKNQWVLAPQILNEITDFVRENARQTHNIEVICHGSFVPAEKKWRAKTAEEVREEDEARMRVLESELAQIRKKLNSDVYAQSK